jgi:hypothetical protein
VDAQEQLNMSKRLKERKKTEVPAVLTYVTISFYLRIYFSCVLRQTGAPLPSEIPYQERERERERQTAFVAGLWSIVTTHLQPSYPV